MIEILDTIVKWIVATVGKLGYPGILVLMFLESSFFPFPSEIIIPPAAYLAAKGEFNIYLVILMGILGSIFGALLNYYLAVKLGRPMLAKLGQYVGLTEKALNKTEAYFNSHGEISTFVGRLIPGIRQYISIPAGLARMNILKFIFFTGLGAGIWVVILAIIGYLVGNQEELIREYVNISLIYILGFISILIFVYILWYRRRRLSR